MHLYEPSVLVQYSSALHASSSSHSFSSDQTKIQTKIYQTIRPLLQHVTMSFPLPRLPALKDAFDNILFTIKIYHTDCLPICGPTAPWNPEIHQQIQ